MLTQYEEYMKRRSELVKAGKSLAEATDRAFLDAYHPEQPKGEDLLSPANQ